MKLMMYQDGNDVALGAIDGDEVVKLKAADVSLPGDLIGERPIDELVLMWLQTEFDGGRHSDRVQKIDDIERDQDESDDDSSSSGEK